MGPPIPPPALKSVELDDLPDRLVAAINQDKFLFAYALLDCDRYVARHVRLDGRTEEIEYDIGLGRLLTVDERRRALPAEGRAILASQAVTVTFRYFFEDETTKLHVTLEVLDEVGTQVLDVNKQLYDPIPWELARVVEEALKKHRFPAVYAAWPRDRKVSYWATTLHRFRRVHGESGRDEDEIYTLELVADLERLDPRVRELLPDILAWVGRLEQTAPATAIAAFTTKTGLVLGPTTPVDR